MATTKVSALSALTTTDGAEELLINDGGTSKKVTIANLLHDNSIDSDHYVDGSIDNAHLADDAVGVAELSATGTASSSTFLRGDNAWATPAAASTATASATGVIKIEDDTDQSVAANTVSTTAGRTYGLQLNSSDQGVVNVPWTDTNTTYTVGDGGLTQINFTSADNTKLDGIEASADVTDATNVTAAGALMDSELAGLAAVKATTGTFLTADQTKLDGIETSADVTDATNVTAAGALMDSEVTNLAAVKAFATSDYATAAQGTTADAALPKAGGTMTGTAVASTNTDATNTGSVTLDFATNQNFVLTLTGNVTLANPTTETVGQSGFIACIQDGTGSRTLSLGTDYETAAGAGITLTSTASATDLVPYLVVAANRILLGTPQLAFA
jgi:hypothetical protein